MNSLLVTSVLRPIVFKMGLVRFWHAKQIRRAGLAAAFIGFQALGFANSVSAGDLAVTVRDDNGELLENAVVTLTPSFQPSNPFRNVQSTEMRQENTLFAPFVLPVAAGTEVTFPNFDEFRHHVYSFSSAKRFELRLYGQDETKAIVFDKPGIVALGCNIHDNMLAYIYVTDAPIFVKTDTDGVAHFEGLENGAYEVSVWHPGMRGKRGAQPKDVLVTDGSVETFDLRLRRVWGVQTPPAGEDY